MEEEIRTFLRKSSEFRSSEYSAVSLSKSVGVEAEDFIIALLEQSEDCVKLISLGGHLDYMNCAGQKVMEIDAPHDVLGKVWWEMWPSETQQLVKDSFQKAVAGTANSFDAICPTAKGTYRRWSVNLKPLISTQGPVVSILCTSRDITP